MNNINEDEVVKFLADESCGFIGDDAAILPNLSPNKYVISKDLLVEDVHFRRKYFTPQDLAYKSLQVNLSDLAAMGAKPLYILCGISIPNRLQDYAVDFLKYLTLECKKIGVILIGGDTTASKDCFFISITAIGEVSDCNIKKRSTAKLGDIVCVAGNLGFAHLGFIGLEQEIITDTQYVNSFLRPQARVNEGMWFGKQKAVTSMMDVSDGLYIDLKRLCMLSKIQATIDIDLLQKYTNAELSLQIMLEGGEDYGLLVTIDKNLFEHFSHEFFKTFGYSLKVVGCINDYVNDTEDKIISFIKNKKSVDIAVNSFVHF